MDDRAAAGDGSNATDEGRTAVVPINQVRDFQRVFADAANVEVIDNTLEIALVAYTRRPIEYRWPEGAETPEGIRYRREAEELARIRMPIAGANNLAMSIIAELAGAFEVDLDKLDQNLANIRAAVVRTMGGNGE